MLLLKKKVKSSAEKADVRRVFSIADSFGVTRNGFDPAAAQMNEFFGERRVRGFRQGAKIRLGRLQRSGGGLSGLLRPRAFGLKTEDKAAASVDGFNQPKKSFERRRSGRLFR